MNKFVVTFEATGLTHVEAEDEDQAEFQAREYVIETYPEFQLGTMTVTSIG